VMTTLATPYKQWTLAFTSTNMFFNQRQSENQKIIPKRSKIQNKTTSPPFLSHKITHVNIQCVKLSPHLTMDSSRTQKRAKSCSFSVYHFYNEHHK
jgi:hypothetical protein